jgi:hypothetical protein
VNCTEWEEQVVLYAGGDLNAPAAAEVERHIAECPGCQLFASGLAESLACIRAAHEAEIAPAHYTALRARVMASVARQKRRARWTWLYAAAAVAAAVLLVAGLRLRVHDLPAVALKTAPPAPAAAWQIASAHRPPELRPVPRRHAPAVRPKTEQVLVKIETGDPDIVVLWIAETKGEN